MSHKSSGLLVEVRRGHTGAGEESGNQEEAGFRKCRDKIALSCICPWADLPLSGEMTLG